MPTLFSERVHDGHDGLQEVDELAERRSLNCDASYFNTVGASLVTQLDFQGSMHPNAAGYMSIYRDAVYSQLQTSIGKYFDELDDTSREKAIAEAAKKIRRKQAVAAAIEKIKAKQLAAQNQQLAGEVTPLRKIIAEQTPKQKPALPKGVVRAATKLPKDLEVEGLQYPDNDE